MDAQIYQLADMRSRRNTRLFTERCFQTQLVSAGLGLLTNATAFWVAYSAAMVSCHHKVLSSAFSPCLKLPKAPEEPSGWRW